MASIKPTKSGYRAQVYVLGVRDSKSFRTAREANAWAAARETEIRADEKKAPGERHTLRDALARYSEEVSPKKRGCLKEQIRLKAFLAEPSLPVDLPIGEITPSHLAAWRDARLRVVQAGSVLRDFGLMSSVFEEARREWKWILVNPLSDVRRPRAPDHREIVIARWQVKAMLRELGYSKRTPVRSVAQAVAVCFLVALRTGMRAGELCGLTWDRVFDGYCRTPHKSGRTEESLRDVPLTAKALASIELMRGYDPKLVFGLKTASLDAMFRKFRNRAGLSGFTFHDSRHTAATWIAGRMKSNNLPAQQALLDLCKIFGWTKLDQALTYFNPDPRDIAKRIL
ncbi:tyrosine-type recombinase/integrase [Dechloromonas sp. CZR5]|uniref:tyrosine-type recombinase/integrase n=1 Tax=Dechloromonas sp. CZR5 TaxID=2608630 RepID=UPI00123DEF54|nr:tyrosine-type recombinase/integrase [Dechloromonas sp. CZR5]